MLHRSQLSQDDRARAMPLTWSVEACSTDLVLIVEPSRISRTFKIVSLLPAGLSLVVVLAFYTLTSLPLEIYVVVLIVSLVASSMALLVRWLEVRGTGNMDDAALKVTGAEVFIGKAGITFPRNWVQRLECIVDYSDDFYVGPGGHEGVNQIWSEVNLIAKNPNRAEPATKFPIVGALGDACLSTARRIAAATGWELTVGGWVYPPSDPADDLKSYQAHGARSKSFVS